MLSLPCHSHLTPNNKSLPPKADLRRPITALRLLIWAFRDECVRAGTNVSETDRFSETGFANTGWERERVQGGLINGLLYPAADAELIEGKLAAWYGPDATGYLQVARAAEKGKALARHGDLMPLRAVPGRTLYTPGGRRPFLCQVTFAGDGPADFRKAEQRHDLFLVFLAAMADFALEKWVVVR